MQTQTYVYICSSQNHITAPCSLSRAEIKLCYFPERPQSMQIFVKPKHLMRQPLATRLDDIRNSEGSYSYSHNEVAGPKRSLDC